MKIVVRAIAASLLAGACALGQPAAAQALGDTVTCATNAYVCAPTSATVGAGTEFLWGPSATPFLNLDFATNLLTVNARYSTVQIGSGATISFRDTTRAFTSATFLANTTSGTGTNPAFAASDLTFTNGLVTLNVGGRTFTSTGVLTIALTNAITAVPEPASWAMMILGAGAAGVALRRRGEPAGRARIA